MLVISPHLDDAVLSCGCLLAARPGCVVATVFAGTPHDASQLTDWDRRCGFTSAGQAMVERRREDRAALAWLDAEPRGLDFCDSQYGQTPPVEAVRDALRELIAQCRPYAVLYPMGLYHSDHLLVHEACRAAVEAFPGTQPLMYEDALYRGMPGLLQQRLSMFLSQGLCATPARLNPQDGLGERKTLAWQSYGSQLKAFGPTGYADAVQPERFWTLDAAETVGKENPADAG